MTVLELGTKGRILAREEHVTLGTEPSEPWRLLYASDLHLTRRRPHLIDRLIEAADATRPDVILLGGDLVDGPSGFESLTDCVRGLCAIARVAAVPGNHDVLFGKSRVRRAVEEGGGLWLADPDLRLAGGAKKELWLHGRPRPSHDPARRRVLVAHHPQVFRHASELGYDLVLAGHLHGGQCVLWEKHGRFYPGAFFLPWNGLRFSLGRTTMLVSRGVADTIPLRFQCPREVLLCHVA